MRLVQGESPMLSTRRVPQLLALRRTDAVVTDAIISSVAQSAKAAGLKLAGVLQRDLQRPGRRRCDMDLTDLASGEVVTWPVVAEWTPALLSRQRVWLSQAFVAKRRIW